MKRSGILNLIIVALILGVWAITPVSVGNAEETLKYSCSNQVYEAFEKEKIEAFTHASGIKVDVHTASSGSCVYRLMSDNCDIASTARKLYRRHAVYGYTEIAFSKDPIAVIARKECGIEDLSEEQLQDIFSGDITNWKEVGGSNLPIMIIVPGKDTAAHKNFRRQIMKRKDIAPDFIAYDSIMVIEAVKHFPCGAVSFISQGAATHHKDLRTIKINGYSPADKGYPYYQIFYYVIKGEPSAHVKKFIDFTFSKKGAEIIRKNGMVPVAR